MVKAVLNEWPVGSFAGDFSVRNRFDLTDRVAMVTGATRGIGLAIAHGLRESGATVVITDIVDRGIEEGGGLHFIPCDIRKPDEITRTVKAVVDRFKRIDVLVNNAAVGVRKPAVEMAVEDWEEVLRINVTGTFLTCREVGKVMMKDLIQSCGEYLLRMKKISSFIKIFCVSDDFSLNFT